MTPPDSQTLWLFGGLFAFLTLATLVGWALRRSIQSGAGVQVVANLNARISAWWLMIGVFGLAILAGKTTTLVLFGLMSFLALREFITLTPTRPGDHRSLFWAFFIITPLHYYTLAIGWYGMTVLLIPVYAFLFIPIRSAIAGEIGDFLTRTAKIQWGLMVCVYFVSYAPALLLLKIPGYDGQNAKLLFYLVTVVQMSDVLQYVWGKLCGRHPIAPRLSPSKTVEGLVGGGLSAIALGAWLHPITPFTALQSAGLSAIIVIMGFFGGLVMSAIKRDRGVKDYGELLPGHGGMMDRIDSLCFAAPVFFHAVRYWFV
ncbi:MAG: phosphatidate cytidylyltransferase [Chitinophagia bacterium]|nr:phosphatidate cytidylyltransferase [Chitinophagia bacterium]